MNSWQRAEQKADELHKALNVLPKHASCKFDRREGMRPSWRVTVTRYSDAMTKTVFVKD